MMPGSKSVAEDSGGGSRVLRYVGMNDEERVVVLEKTRTGL